MTENALTKAEIDIRKARFWNGLIRAARAEPREPTPITGASGIRHEVLALGVDDKQKRIILVSADHDARSAALMQSDVQNTFSDGTRIIVTRPVAIDLASIASAIRIYFGRSNISLDEIAKEIQGAEKGYFGPLLEHVMPLVSGIGRAVSAAPVNYAAIWMQAVQQLSRLSCSPAAKVEDDESGLMLGLSNVINYDSTEIDRKMGIGAIPLHEFSERDIEVLLEQSSNDDINSVFDKYGVMSYFFPHVDEVALGLMQRLDVNKKEIVKAASESPQIGHPFSSPAFSHSLKTIQDYIDDFQDKGLAVQGDVSIELTPAGESLRAQLQVKPQEGLITKLVNKASIKNVFDAIKMGKDVF